MVSPWAPRVLPSPGHRPSPGHHVGDASQSSHDDLMLSANHQLTPLARIEVCDDLHAIVCQSQSEYN